MGAKAKLEDRVDAMEIEMLNPSDEAGPASRRRCESLLGMLRLYVQMHPRAFMFAGGLVAFLLLRSVAKRNRSKALFIPPHLVNHFGNVEAYYDLKISQIDHWCLHGGDHDCTCEDPTEPEPREGVKHWIESHELNRQRAQEAVEAGVDVVFLGDQFVQAWDGNFLGRRIVGADAIQKKFGETFQRENGGLVDGIALGIAGDTTSNLLWRIQNGEIPKDLNPKVWWIMIGANDLAIDQCSEEAVIVGILRLADEIKMKYPDTTVVVQGLLPRSSYEDGHLKSVDTTASDSAALDGPKKKEYFKVDNYPLWPSIQVINKEIETFCAKHEHLVFYDASEIFFGAIGNEYYKAAEKVLIKELFKKDLATPSTQGFEILTTVIGKEVVNIVYEEDESNHKATKREEGHLR